MKNNINKLIKPILIAMMLVVAVSPTVQAAISSDGKTEQTIDIVQAVQIAVARHPSVLAARQTVQQYGGEVAAAKSGKNFQFNFGLKASNERGYSNNSKQSTSAVVSVNKMLYDFGKTDSEVAYAKAREQHAFASYNNRIEAIALLSASAYLDVLRYQQQLAETEKQLAAIEHILYIVDLRSQAGISSYADVVQVKARLASAEANLTSVKTQLWQQENRLNLYLGFRPTFLQPIDTALFQKEEATAVDFTQMPDYEEAIAEVNAAKANYKALKAQSYPALALQGEVGKALDGRPSSYDKNGQYRAVYLTLNEPLGGSGIHERTGAAQNSLAAAEQQLAAIVLEKNIVLANYLEQVTGYKSMLAFVAAQTTHTKLTKELYLDQYMLGKRSILDLLNVEQELYQTAVQRNQLNFDILKTLLTYQKECGQLRTIFDLAVSEKSKESEAQE